ncbi:MAG: TonB-dependent receptor, partial [Pseudomonadota bacterium]
IDVTYFNETLTDEISGFGASVVNLDGDSERQGVEVSLNLRPVDGLAVGASYTYLEASEPDGSEEVRRPQHSAGVNAAYTFYEERATVGADVTYFGDNVQRDFSDDSFTSPKVDVDGYLVVDLNASFEVTENVSIIGKVENAFDNDYQEVLGFGSQPLAATVGLKVKF